MKRRLDVGLGIVHRPAVLFLDEPTTGLDPQARARMWDEVRRLREQGTTVFLTTHYLDEADALADRLAIIDHGMIVAAGTSDELKRQVAGDVVTLGVDGAMERVLETVRLQPFVREASGEDGFVRLYVDVARRPAAAPPAPRRCGARAGSIALHRPEPRRRLPAPDRPLAARRAGRLITEHPRTGTLAMKTLPRHLADLPPLARPDPPPAGLALMGIFQPILYLVLFGPLLEGARRRAGADRRARSTGSSRACSS